MRLFVAIILAAVILLVFALGIFLLIPFPIAIFQSIVDSQVYLQQKSDGQLPTGTFYWSKIPAVQIWTFHLFNVTNPDEVLYYGATPNMLEIGPYTYTETEFKDFTQFRDNDNEIFYVNNKTWVYDPTRSCEDCKLSDSVQFANTAYMSTVFMQIYQPAGPIVGFGLDVLTILLGEQPLRTVTAGGTLFDGYNDPLITLINSPLVKVLLSVLGNPVQLPQVPAAGFFPHYSHTCDGNYTIRTGKDNTDYVGQIKTWNGLTHLPWWKTEDTSDLRGTCDGTIQKPGIQKTDTVVQFQSFLCRKYNLHYHESKTVNSIPTYGFKVEDDSYDAIKNPGYRYENFEKVNYFPNWPCGLNHTKQNNGNCALVDCNQYDNFCNACCDGSHVNGTYVMPPGMVPQRCLPGQMVPTPFGAILSAPHFYGAPKVVTESMVGIHPDPELHRPGTFYINPATGSTIGGEFRMMLSIPVFQSLAWTLMSNAPNAIMPSFTLTIGVVMKDYAVNYIYFNTVTIPNIVLGLGIGFTAVSLIAVLLWGFCYFRSKRNAKPFVLQQHRTEPTWSVAE
ncbi:SCAVenger receptor (CD36 family) related [Caenorhabditis elegans]|uniref:SCAVenger receptor (CD36 family) related n=1 Tax=Caenorhabditis elegans TaxID=6239 RepID=Q19344_CAEEL|nr:SCAVenger receptor (CD36 family) related [Caenorhabditis elegans]CAA91027.2 SCAVenger receptor (CD36 family) related [Caenorhabditis elegans]|eukprot:NP_510157.2 SCAVenger receptor (CD36 family) related [Caenorhabditis elegans]